MPVAAVVLAFAAAHASPASAQTSASSASLRFFGTGVNQQDRVRIPVDDDAPGPDASASIDVGAGDFTLEFWLKGALADNPTVNAGGDQEFPDARWTAGNVVLDRDILGGSDADFGVSIAGGFVRFGTGRGAAAPFDAEHTLEGDVLVLDGAWHHVAVTREAATGVKRIYVDGALDVASSANASRADLSYPDDGVPNQGSPWGPYLVVGAAKHDLGPASPSFTGRLDELRIWNVARGPARVLEAMDRVLLPNFPGLVGSYRFDEGAGTVVKDSSGAGAPQGTLVAGTAGNGEWSTAASGATNVAVVSNSGLPPGFERTVLTTQLKEPTTLEFLPDGRLLIAERGGMIRVWHNGQLLAQPLVQVAVDTEHGERGILGLAAHPQFAQNGWLYVFHTSPEPRDRVSRFTVVGNTANPGTQTLIWQDDALSSDFHHAGGLEFGADGRLYVTVGDHFVASDARKLDNLHGKLLRLVDDGSIPPDNPFVGIPGAKPAIYARGLRNPFRLARDAQTGALWIGDVGGNTSSSSEEIELAAAGADYGWPEQEGDDCYAASCAGITSPHWSYPHDDHDYYIVFPQGSVTCGPVMRSGFPAAYQGQLYVADFANRWIRRLTFDGGGAVLLDPLFLFPPYAGSIVDLAEGPDGALYTLTFGGTFAGLTDPPTLARIRAPGAGNAAPVVVAGAAPSAGLAPLVVQFSSAGTFDPDAGPQPLSYLWEFGDGASATTAAASHVYAGNGVYQARLRVSDGASTSYSEFLPVEVGTKPVPSILAPAAGFAYQAGDVVAFSGAATDAEDGVLGPGSLSWQVVLKHAGHEHPFLGPQSGARGAFTVPTDGHDPENTHYEIRLTATDSDGLSATASVAVLPKTALLGFSSEPPGVPLLLDGEGVLTPALITSVPNFAHDVEAPEAFVVGGTLVAFSCWSDGQPRVHSVTAPQGGLNLTAHYVPVGTSVWSALVPAADRNAEHTVATGQAFASALDAFGVCAGRDAGGVHQAGFEFVLNVPQGAAILSAHLELVATQDQAGVPALQIGAYDVGAAMAFVAGSATPLTQHAPLVPTSIPWLAPAVTAGQTYSTPELAGMLQEVVDRADFQAGNPVGFVLDGAPTSGAAWRCVRNAQSGQPARLLLTYAVLPPPASGCPEGCGFSTVGAGVAPTHVLALAGGGDPRVGGVAEFLVGGLGGAPGAVLLVSLSKAAPPYPPLEGGYLLVGAQGFLGVVFLPNAAGFTGAPIPIPADPALAGFTLALQAAAQDASQPFGAVFSNGLNLVICPP